MFAAMMSPILSVHGVVAFVVVEVAALAPSAKIKKSVMFFDAIDVGRC